MEEEEESAFHRSKTDFDRIKKKEHEKIHRTHKILKKLRNSIIPTPSAASQVS